MGLAWDLGTKGPEKIYTERKYTQLCEEDRFLQVFLILKFLLHFYGSKLQSPGLRIARGLHTMGAFPQGERQGWKYHLDSLRLGLVINNRITKITSDRLSSVRGSDKNVGTHHQFLILLLTVLHSTCSLDQFKEVLFS